MLTTGLVSLNVHEALTFDGTEIVLHPDLFAQDGLSTVNSIGTSTGRHTTSNIRPSSSTVSNSNNIASSSGSVAGGIGTTAPQGGADSGRDGSQSATAASSQQPSQQASQQQQATLTPNPSSDGGKLAWAAGTGGASTASQRRLEVGDMIEIRVWDPVPLRDRQQSPGGVSGVFRKRGGASVQSNQSSAGSGSTEAQKSNTTTSNNNKKGSNASAPSAAALTTTSLQSTPAPPPIPSRNTLDSVASNLSRKMSATTQSSSANSMQYSEFSASEHNTVISEFTPPTSSRSLALTASVETDSASTVAGGSVVVDDGTSKSKDTQVPGTSTSAVAATSINNNDATFLPPSPVPPTKNVITIPYALAPSAGGKPPVFARGRANTAESTRMPTSNALPKPPLQPRASTHGETFAAYEARKRSSKPIHTRDISDMTTDSMVHGLSHNFPPQHHQHQHTSSISSNNHVDFNVLGVDFADQQGDDEETEDIDEDTQGDDVLSIIGKSHIMRFSFAMLVTEKTLTSLKGSARTQVSMLRQVADLYKLSSYDMVSINRIEKDDEPAVLQAVSADFVLFSMKDQFISRGDMHLFQKALIGSWLYEGQRLTEVARGIKAHAWLIRHGNQPAKSGIVTEDTMITFRSRSSRIFWLVQISAEMWDYASPYERERGDENESICEIYFDKWISFVHRLFDRWKALEVTHSLTIVFFSRTFLSSRQAITINADGGSLDCKDVYGRPFEDHYKTVIENETNADWGSLVVRLKEEFLKYPLEVGWNLSTGDLGRRPSNASQGNVLEAINLATNLLQSHFLDRDLQRTGNSIVVISPGCGVFEVDKGLASITYQRMMDNGIGSDMLSLSLPPLHIAPFFLYNNEYRTVESRGVDTSETYYEIPHWMHLSFILYEGEADTTGQPQARSEEVQLPKKFHLADSSLPVAANGFILPRKDSFDSLVPSIVKGDPNSPTSFSVNGIAASSPLKLKPMSQERALNEGRDFLDILEACRPRNSGSMPSALQAILKMYRRSEKIDRTLSETSNEDKEEGETDELKPLREWSSMDFDAVDVTRPRSGSFGLNEKSERSDSSALSSPSSSYASLVGVNFDRHLIGRSKGSAPLGGVHLQRSLSLQLVVEETNEDTDTVKSDGSWSTMGPDGTGGPATEDDLTSLKAPRKERNRRANDLRKIMANHDSNYFAEPQVPIVAASADALPSRQQAFPPLNESVGTLSPVAGIPLSSQRFSSTRNEASQSGGLGAALSHYSVSHDGTMVGDSISNRIRMLNPTDSIGSTRARLVEGAGILSLRGSQWNDLGARGISPLLLPPAGMGPGSDPPDRVRRPDDRLLSSRLLPREYKAATIGAGARSLNTAYTPRAPTSNLLSGDLFTDPRNTTTAGPTSGVKSIGGGGSPRGGDLHRGNTTKKADKHGHRNREASHRHGRKKAFNPFRQADEDKMLAKRSHNRRRWSHVFPQGEIEFKRHAGPNWKSLTSPAILPLSVDYFPSRQEIDQFFQFNIYNVTLSDFEDTPYSTHADLLMEMVRQRISQDYQLVPPSCVDETIRRAKSLVGHAPFGTRGRATSVIPNPPSGGDNTVQTIKHFLTMGHQLQELTYDPSSDTIEVVRFNEKSAQNDELNTYKYQYLLYSHLTQKYTKVVQTFKKYANQYNWNKVDRIVCGDEDKTLRDGMRFRRLMFALIPPKFSTPQEEEDYIAKFKRLSEYMCNLREADNATLEVNVLSSADPKPNLYETRNVTGAETMQRSAVQLRKGKQDPFEWIELATDSEFSTAKSYRIVYNWLAASSGKVDTQIQFLHRRCTQYGLSLVFFPQTSISRDLLLNPFKTPPTFCVRDEEKAKLLYTSLLELDFVNDGVFYTQTKPILECIEHGDEFDFGRRLSTAARQFVHRSGLLFVRLIRDRRGWVIAVVIPNGHHIKKDEEKHEPVANHLFRDFVHLVGSLTEDDEE